MKKTRVSIICLTYNQEKYIEQTLKGFLMQKTNFEYEILINDDASTDTTASIIKRYEKKYPDIIKPVYQTENQYSQGNSITLNILLPLASGKYITWCEGDDYWLDEYKLQKQYDYMEAHPECSLCVHNFKTVTETDELIQHMNLVHESSHLTTEQVIEGGGNYLATNSLFSRRKYIETLPAYFEKGVLDYTWQMYFASQGSVYCFSDCMSAYRISSQGSWTNDMKESSLKKRIHHFHQMKELLEAFDKENQYKYHHSVLKMKTEYDIEEMKLTKNDAFLKTEEFKEYMTNLSKKDYFKKKLHIFLARHCPDLLPKVSKMYENLKNSKKDNYIKVK